MVPPSSDAPETRTAVDGATAQERSTATLTTVAAGARGRDSALPAGTVIGRYTLIERLGRGGMGVVYKAYDPELGRLIAVKLLRFRRRVGDNTGRPRERLVREAHALAQLSHPNVIAVYDAGEYEGAVFLAMELVQGQSLQGWLAERPRGWREVLAVLCPAGRGLAAAHAAGLIHRDVKPGNIMLGNDGRVHVIDFGLARAADGAAHDLELPSGDDSSSDHSDRLLETPLTRRGVIIGTPQYMPPEQSDHGTLDARSDQFSFCVTLYEALYGVRPFAGKRAKEVADAVRARRLTEPERKHRVPAWLHRAVLRGLSADPADRFPDMHRLLAELTRDHAQRVRRVAIGGGVIAAVAVAAVLGGRSAEREAPCTTAAAELAPAWDAAARARVHEGFAATPHPLAGDTADRVSRALDAYAHDWIAMRTAACKATHVHQSQSTQALDARNACLDRRRSQLGSLVDVFATTEDVAVLDRAVQAALALPSLAPCEHAVTLLAVEPAPAADAPRIAAVRAELDRALALSAAGAYAEGAAVARTALTEARAIGYAPLVAEALFRFGGLHDKSGQPDEAAEAWYEAAGLATQSGADRLAAETWIELMWSIGFREAQFEPALVMHRVAEATLARIDAEPELRAHLENTLGVVYIAKGSYDLAIDHLETALATRANALGADHYTLSHVHDALGLASEYAGNLDDARRHAERSLAIREASLGPEHPDIAFAQTNLGEVYLKSRDYERAEAYAARALALREKQLGPDHPGLGAPLGTLASVAIERGQFDRAEKLLDRALAIYADKLGEEHPSAAAYHDRYGDLLARRGQHAGAIERRRTVIALVEKAAGKDHPDIAVAMTRIGESQLALGQRAEALETLERAVAMTEGQGVPAGNRAEAQFALARALWSRRASRPRSLELARAARAAYDDVPGGDQAEQRRALDDWLAAHPP